MFFSDIILRLMHTTVFCTAHRRNIPGDAIVYFEIKTRKMKMKIQRCKGVHIMQFIVRPTMIRYFHMVYGLIGIDSTADEKKIKKNEIENPKTYYV